MFISLFKKRFLKTCLKVSIILFWVFCPHNPAPASLSSLTSRHFRSLPHSSSPPSPHILPSSFTDQRMLFYTFVLCVFAHEILSAWIVYFLLGEYYHIHSSSGQMPHLLLSPPWLLCSPPFQGFSLFRHLCCSWILSLICHSPGHVLFWIDIYVSIFSTNLQATLGHLLLSKVPGIHSVLNKYAF